MSEEIGRTEYVGITRVVRKKHETENRGLENKIDINDYIDWIYVGASWNECHNIEAFEFFNPFSKRPPYQSWTNAVPCNEKSILARLTLYKGLHEYHLIKKKMIYTRMHRLQMYWQNGRKKEEYYWRFVKRLEMQCKQHMKKEIQYIF